MRIAVGDRFTTALRNCVGQARALMVCAHGAGGHMSDGGMERIAAVLCEQGIEVVRFNFLYREGGSRRPDAMPLLKKTFEAVVAHVRDQIGSKRLLLGGRSMGGRVASMMAADEFACDGLLLFAYPLHPPGQPEKLRSAHLPKIRMPVLCFNGTRDAFCTRELMERSIEPLESLWTMHWLEGADHSFRTLKSSGRKEADLYREVGEGAGQWLRTTLL
jgi:predicted alpha/beta-hydrolase family hydrolase